MSARKRLRRIGCGILLILWFAFLIIVPCGAITLISGNEIKLTHSDVPDDDTLRMWLIQQPEERGLGVSMGYTVSPAADMVCTVTDTRFFLWRGKGPASHGCACYQKQSDSYMITSTGDEACRLAGK